MSVVSTALSTGLSIATAGGVLLTGIGGMRTRDKVNKVHDEVSTENGRTLGELVEKVVAPAVAPEALTDTTEPQPPGPEEAPPPRRG